MSDFLRNFAVEKMFYKSFFTPNLLIGKWGNDVLFVAFLKNSCHFIWIFENLFVPLHCERNKIGYVQKEQ
jgi:hypothetical protein